MVKINQKYERYDNETILLTTIKYIIDQSLIAENNQQ